MTGKLLNQPKGRGHRFHQAVLYFLTKQRQLLGLLVLTGNRTPETACRWYWEGRKVQDAGVFTL